MSGTDAFGSTLSRGDGASAETFTAVGSVTSIRPPGLTRQTYDVTAHDSPNQWMEFIGGLKDGGRVTADLNYAPGTHDTLVADLDDATARNWQVAFPDGTVWEFAAFLTGFEPNAPHDNKLSATLTFKVTGEPTITNP